ncbi:hypothetical protein [Lysobacter fragariae]
MKQGTYLALVATAIAALSCSPAYAADGAICYSPIFSETGSSTIPSTTTYPQLLNAHKFNCGWATTYTIKELSQLGWIISSIQPTVYSSSINSDGSSVTRTRYMLVIQK